MDEQITKTAAPGFMGKFFRGGPGGKATGQFVKNTEEQIPVMKNSFRMYTPEEVMEARKNEIIQEGTNGLVTDSALGLTKMIGPKTRQAVDKGVYWMKNNLEKADTALATPIAGKNLNNPWGRFMSVPTGKNNAGHVVGEVMDDDGKVIDHLYRGSGGENRRASLLAPVSNTAKVVAPILGTTYVAEKMYGDGQKSNYQEEMSKASENVSYGEEKHGILEEEILAFELDKQASMQKIAQLETEIEKYSAVVEDLQGKVQLLTKEASVQRKEKEDVLQKLASSKQSLIEKTAEHEEFRLRMIARERSDSAVKLAERMLEEGLIKQADFDKQVDKLMDCDEETFNLHTKLVKHAKKEDEGLETLDYLVDYRSNDADSTSALNRGYTKKGQSIGDAAKDLIK